MEKKRNNHIAVGLDIGTTTVSAIVMDSGSQDVLSSYTVPHGADLPAKQPWEHLQSPQRIWEIVTALLDRILAQYSVSVIGVTGQMHGVMHTAADGTPLSALYTWQDLRARNGEDSACRKIRELTGYHVPAGYGLATEFALLLEGKLPPQPYYACTIMDDITMRLCGLSRPVMHITNAAAWGLYCHDEQDFDETALQKIGIPREILPTVISQKEIVGVYRGIPVAVGIGDNQAAFLGSVTEVENTVLINVGTGSQVSLLSKELVPGSLGLIEARPFDGESVLYSGSGLCGGRSYALLEQMFRKYAVACGLADEARYEILNALAAEEWDRKNILRIRTTFAGTRKDPNMRGEILGIGEENFTPGALAIGILYGIVEELYQMYESMPAHNVTQLVASGNGVRKNPLLRNVISEIFGMEAQIPSHTEEAAFGAAIFGADAAL